MEKYNLKTVSLAKVGEPDQHGNHAYNIGFENGESGFFKCKDQNLFNLGEISTFYMGQVEGRNGAMYNKIMRVSAVENQEQYQKKSSAPSTSESGNVKSNETSDMINRSVAIKAACELYSQSNNNSTTMALEAAAIFFDYIQFGITDAQPANVEQNLKTPSTVDPNVLPF